jgi:hypothetical protein
MEHEKEPAIVKELDAIETQRKAFVRSFVYRKMKKTCEVDATNP